MSKKSAKSNRSEPARKAQEMMRAQQAKARRRTVLIQAGVALVAVVAVLAVTIAVLSAQDGDEPASTPSAVDDQGALVLGNPDAPVTVQVVEDFQCPACKSFERANAELLSSFIEGDEVNVAFRGIAFLDQASSTNYSTRALNASACVMEEDEGAWQQFHQALFEQQPPEGGEGLSDDQLVDNAVAAGVSEDAVRPCIEDQTYADWTASTTAQSNEDGVEGTPTVFVNGEKVEAADPASLQAAVDEAAQAAS